MDKEVGRKQHIAMKSMLFTAACVVALTAPSVYAYAEGSSDSSSSIENQMENGPGDRVIHGSVQLDEDDNFKVYVDDGEGNITEARGDPVDVDVGEEDVREEETGEAEATDKGTEGGFFSRLFHKEETHHGGVIQENEQDDSISVTVIADEEPAEIEDAEDLGYYVSPSRKIRSTRPIEDEENASYREAPEEEVTETETEPDEEEVEAEEPTDDGVEIVGDEDSENEVIEEDEEDEAPVEKVEDDDKTDSDNDVINADEEPDVIEKPKEEPEGKSEEESEEVTEEDADAEEGEDGSAEETASDLEEVEEVEEPEPDEESFIPNPPIDDTGPPYDDVEPEAAQDIREAGGGDVNLAPQPEIPEEVQSPVSYPTYTAGDSEDVLLAKLIYHESGNQPYDGRVAVAEVVMNRVYSSLFPNNVTDVIYQPHQFSYNNEIAGCPVTEENLGIARRVLAGTERVFYNPEVLYFRNPMITSGIKQSSRVDWGKHNWYSYIGGHTFYTQN